MDVFVSNWQVILIGLAVLFVLTGILRRLVKLAIVGALLGVLGLVIWPIIAA